MHRKRNQYLLTVQVGEYLSLSKDERPCFGQGQVRSLDGRETNILR